MRAAGRFKDEQVISRVTGDNGCQQAELQRDHVFPPWNGVAARTCGGPTVILQIGHHHNVCGTSNPGNTSLGLCWGLPFTGKAAALRRAIHFQLSAGAFEGRGQDAAD